VDKIAVMHKGRIVDSGTPKEIFKNYQGLISIGLDIPQITHLMLRLKQKGKNVATDVLSVDEAEAEILKVVRGKGRA